jgi:hypothetical protein
MIERLCIRILIVLALCVALVAFLAAPVPVAANGEPDLPDIALGQVGLYRLEVALLAFHGILLLATPAFSGLIRGRLPIEISIRGTKFADEASRSAKRDEAAIRAVERRLDRINDRLTFLKIELDDLKGQVTVSDRR